MRNGRTLGNTGDENFLLLDVIFDNLHRSTTNVQRLAHVSRHCSNFARAKVNCVRLQHLLAARVHLQSERTACLRVYAQHATIPHLSKALSKDLDDLVFRVRREVEQFRLHRGSSLKTRQNAIGEV